MIEKTDPKRKDLVNKVLETIQKNEINFVRLQLTDINGVLKSFAVRSKDLENYLPILMVVP
jgi:glutamine synthetase